MHDTKEPFSERRRLMTVRQDVMEVARQIRACLAPGKEAQLRDVLKTYHPADLADAMLFLSDQEDAAVFQALDTTEAAEVLDEVDATTKARLVGITGPDRLADIVAKLPPDEGADILGGLPEDRATQTLALTEPEKAREIHTLLAYPKNTAGGIMSLGYVDVPETATQAEALARFREKRGAEPIFYLYVVDAQGGLRGAVDLRTLLSADPATPVRDVMEESVITVHPDCDQEQVAHVFARYDLTVLPVVSDEPDGRLLGVITADDIIDVIQEEANEDLAHLSGSDAQELERKSPAQVAKLRLPWIMATMFIELVAGFVIHDFDRTLTRYILLASFMPIISAISGNTGLQSAAIIIRGLSTGHVSLAHWRHAVMRQLTTTALLGGACALVLGIIGGLWDREWVFGLTVFLGMFLAVNIAGVVGTVVPLLSKRAGFDPALTAGPFETAFQDVVGISIFLSLATLLLRWLH
jgi:magnesium transporter